MIPPAEQLPRKRRKKTGTTLFLLLLFGVLACREAAADGPITMVTWNIESGGSSPEVIAEQLARFREFDIIALQEVDDKKAGFFEGVFGPEYDGVLSVTGSRVNDHLLVIYNTAALSLRRSMELHSFEGVTITPDIEGGGKRSPLVLFFTIQTASDRHGINDGGTDNANGSDTRNRTDGSAGTGWKGDFICVNVHFSRSNAAHRSLQAFVLREWILSQTEPVVVLGDFNFDYNYLEPDPGNAAYKIFTFPGRGGASKTIRWIRPDILLDTNYSERNGKETYPHSVLDFVFAANGAEEWDITSTIIQWEDDFPDNEKTSDHRPVAAIMRQ